MYMKSINLKYIINKFNYLIIILVILIIVYIIYKFQVKEYYSEIMCIGAGVSNAYACYQIKQQNINNDKIIVLEKEPVMGGRIRSVYSNVYKQDEPEVEYAELGAARLFDVESMRKLFRLLEVLDLKTINVPLDDGNNVFFYKGKEYAKSNVYLNNGLKASKFDQYAVDNFLKSQPGVGDDVLNDKELQDDNVYDFLKKYGDAKMSDVQKWISYSGYDYYSDYTQARSLLVTKDFYNQNLKDKQYYLLSGMISLVKKLFENSNAEIVYNTKAVSIEKDSHGYTVINTINSNNQYRKYKCKYLFIGLTAKQIEELNSYKRLPISSTRLDLMSQALYFPLFKLVLKWDKDKIWWGKGKRFVGGKSTTDLPIRQVIYYNDEDIMVYSTGVYATELNNKFMKNEAAAAVEVYEDIKRVHQMDIPPPNYVYTIYKYWPDGSHKWRLGAKPEENKKIIPNGVADKSNIFIVGDAYSDYQGWIIGAINSVDEALDSLKKVIN